MKENESDEPLLRKTSRTISRMRQLLAAVGSAYSGVLFGVTLGYPAETLPRMIKEGVMTLDQSTWFTSALIPGVALGGAIGALLIDVFGRKAFLLILYLPFVIGWWCIAGSDILSILCIGRVICGIASGISLTVCTIYVAEIATDDYRGVLSSVYFIFMNFGVFIVDLLGIGIDWRSVALIGTVLSACGVLISLPLPESPRWLLGNGLKEEAQKALVRLRGEHVDIQNEYYPDKDSSSGNSRYWPTMTEVRRPSFYKPTLISVGLIIAQQAGGYVIFLFYTNTIYMDAGWTGSPTLPTATVAAAQLVGCIIVVFLIDVCGRKIIMVATGIIETGTLIAMSIVYYLSNLHPNPVYGWVSVVCLVLNMFLTAIGIGSLAPIVIAEINPAKHKGFVCGITQIVLALATFIYSSQYEHMFSALKPWGALVLLSVFNSLGVVFVALAVPETKGKSLEEIGLLFVEKKQGPKVDHPSTQPYDE